MTKDLFLFNAGLVFDSPENPDALWISDSIIKAVGNSADLKSQLSNDANFIDLEGKTVLPGLTDFHLHLQYLADKLDAVDCQSDNIGEVLRRVERRAEITPAGDWIIGYGWNQNDWNPADYGTAAQLDAISQSHPILLHAKSLHAAWANSLALRLAGIDAHTPNPDKGVILHDTAGQPSGILLEYAIPLVEKHIPQPTASSVARKIQLAQNYLHSLGITGVHNFDRFEAADALLLLADQDLLRLRVSQNLPSEQLNQVVEEGWRKKLTRPPYLQPGWLKIFADGALGPQSASLLEPYEGSQDSGLLLISAQELAEIGMKASKESWPLSVHAIGDRAVREVLNGMEILRKFERENNLPHLPHRIEHVQLIHPDDLRRMKRLDLIASVQPSHAVADMFTAQHHWGKRCQYAYAYQSMRENGLKIRFGSDAPVENSDPFEGIYAAISRKRFTPVKEGISRADVPPHTSAEMDGEGYASFQFDFGENNISWYPQQRLSLQDSLNAFTMPLSSSPDNPEHPPLSAGSPADMIVLESNPFDLNPEQIYQLRPLLTIVAGEIVFSR